MSFEDKIKELKLLLPEAKDPVGSYVATKMSLVFWGGHCTICLRVLLDCAQIARKPVHF